MMLSEATGSHALTHNRLVDYSALLIAHLIIGLCSYHTLDAKRLNIEITKPKWRILRLK